MNKIRNNRNILLRPVKGMIFVIVLMLFSTSCCITGYCQTSPADTQQETEGTPKKQ